MHEARREKTAKAIERGINPAAYQGQQVAVVMPDLTRQISLDDDLAPLLSSLKDAGAARLELIIALGLHRPMTEPELAPIRALAARFGATLRQHDPDMNLLSTSQDVGLGDGAGALPASFCEAVVCADRRVCVGVVEPHQYAGFSGGIKAISIGCASAQTIGAMHGLTYLRHPRTTLGVFEGNPFQAALWRLGQTLGPTDALGRVRASAPGDDVVGFGDVRACFFELIKASRALHFEPHAARAKALLVDVPQAKASNFYQASRAATYIALVERTILEPGGWILLNASCEEGFGQGVGERACEEALGRGLEALREELYHGPARALAGGEQRAFVLAKALERANIALIGSPKIPALAKLGILQFDDETQALAHLGLSDVRRIKDPFHQLPQLS